MANQSGSVLFFHIQACFSLLSFSVKLAQHDETLIELFSLSLLPQGLDVCVAVWQKTKKYTFTICIPAKKVMKFFIPNEGYTFHPACQMALLACFMRLHISLLRVYSSITGLTYFFLPQMTK